MATDSKRDFVRLCGTYPNLRAQKVKNVGVTFGNSEQVAVGAVIVRPPEPREDGSFVCDTGARVVAISFLIPEHYSYVSGTKTPIFTVFGVEKRDGFMPIDVEYNLKQ